MREVEIKIKVPDLNGLREKLESLGCQFGDSVEQEDVVYTRNIGSLETFLANSEFLRIRTQSNGKKIFTYKRQRVNVLKSLNMNLR